MFTPERPLQSACTPFCALALARLVNEKKAKTALLTEKRADRVKLEKLKTRSDWIKEAQIAFNTWVRTRDAGKPCICCGRMGNGQVPGGEWDAGHYRSRGAAPHLRFDERNVHAQLKQCNRYASGNISGYRFGLIERIGASALDALESDQTERRWSIEDLQAIKSQYAAKTRELLKQRESV
jgi:hypothetical protein